MYVFLAASPRDLAFISVTLVLFVLFTVLSLLPQARRAVSWVPSRDRAECSSYRTRFRGVCLRAAL